MGRPSRPIDKDLPILVKIVSTAKRGLPALFVAGAFACTCVAFDSAPAGAQTLSDTIAKRANGENKGRMIVDAREIVYNNDTNRVSAVGDVQIYYNGRVIEADKVIYDKANSRLYAEGNVRITESDGTRATGERFELTDDFKDGFVDTLRVDTPDGQRFLAGRAERTDGETTVFEKGIYTYCKGCAPGRGPEKPPLWKVRAARIISKNSEQTIYYEDATIEFFDVPIAWVPYFSTSDPSVTRKTGWISPGIINSSSLGFGVTASYFWAIAPDYDLTLTPSVLSRQGFLGQAEWRQRLSNGSYNIKAAGIFQQDKTAFPPFPYGENNRDFRGSIETRGSFLISDKWSFGWDVTAQTDKYFLQNYKIKSNGIGLASNYFQTQTSQIYLNGKGDRSWFDLRGYYFQGVSYATNQKTTPEVLPVLDYDRRFETPVGGEFAINANLTSLKRDTAAYQELRSNILNPTSVFRFNNVSIYDDCAVRNPNVLGPRNQGCILRGIGGSYTRASVNLTWRRQFIDPLGQVWTPFTGVRADVIGYSLNGQAPAGLGNTTFNNDQRNFLSADDQPLGQVIPTVGLEYRYPFVATASWGTQIIEPIGQIIARTDEQQKRRLPNEDAQSLVFDDTNIFEWNKFSGYDRTEGGVRANVGGQYTATTNGGQSANLLFGQSYQVAGRNSFQRADVANVGLDSGLQNRVSDYVARVAVQPVRNSSIIVRGRFDEKNFALRRAEVQANNTIGPVTNSLTYQRIGSQPDLGFTYRREGVLSNTALRFGNGWQVSSGVLVDLSRYLYEIDYANAYNVANPAAVQVVPNTSRFRPSAFSFGLGYYDEGTAFSITYSRNYNDLTSTNTRTTSDAVLVKLELKHLGDVKYNYTTSDSLAPTEVGLSR